MAIELMTRPSSPLLVQPAPTAEADPKRRRGSVIRRPFTGVYFMVSLLRSHQGVWKSRKSFQRRLLEEDSLPHGLLERQLESPDEKPGHFVAENLRRAAEGDSSVDHSPGPDIVNMAAVRIALQIIREIRQRRFAVVASCGDRIAIGCRDCRVAAG